MGLGLGEFCLKAETAPEAIIQCFGRIVDYDYHDQNYSRTPQIEVCDGRSHICISFAPAAMVVQRTPDMRCAIGHELVLKLCYTIRI